MKERLVDMTGRRGKERLVEMTKKRGGRLLFLQCIEELVEGLVGVLALVEERYEL